MSESIERNSNEYRRGHASRARHSVAYTDPVHEESTLEASNGLGTSQGPPLDGGELNHPILDGSTQSDLAEATVENPHRGQIDPALITRQPALNRTSSTRWIIAAAVALIVVSGVLIALFEWNPLWSAIGIAFALFCFIAMIVMRQVDMTQRARLRTDAILLGLLWVVPLAIAGVIFASTITQISQEAQQLGLIL